MKTYRIASSGSWNSCGPWPSWRGRVRSLLPSAHRSCGCGRSWRCSTARPCSCSPRCVGSTDGRLSAGRAGRRARCPSTAGAAPCRGPADGRPNAADGVGVGLAPEPPLKPKAAVWGPDHPPGGLVPPGGVRSPHLALSQGVAETGPRTLIVPPIWGDLVGWPGLIWLATPSYLAHQFENVRSCRRRCADALVPPPGGAGELHPAAPARPPLFLPLGFHSAGNHLTCFPAPSDARFVKRVGAPVAASARCFLLGILQSWLVEVRQVRPGRRVAPEWQRPRTGGVRGRGVLAPCTSGGGGGCSVPCAM